MKYGISVSMITKNAEHTIEQTLRSVHGWVDEIVIVDDHSTDRTVEIAKQYSATVHLHAQPSEGLQRVYALSKIKNEWILVLDSDEVVSKELREEILKTIHGSTPLDGYWVPFQSFFINKPLNHGGEQYSKLILFQHAKVSVLPVPIHSVYTIPNGKVGTLQNKMLHYSYLSTTHVWKKLISYAHREAVCKKTEGVHTSMKDVILNPLFMFYARFLKQQGYKDGLFRVPLDLAYAYREFLIALMLLKE
ncbi:glycosyltransferase family 2 protein [Candidatus Roizmanbacteria bacterium]|nr:glycosyltransferase family 2 protein [Candidatus Roizmanbacteria bacterium]